jgi:phage tail sheath gpL-like
MRLSLPTRLASAAAVAVLAASGVLMTAGAASATGKGPKTEATFLHLNNKAVAHAKHHTDTISGKLTADSKGRPGVTGETVTLFTWSRKHKSFVSTGLTATTGTGGAFSFTITAPTRTSHYEAKFAGDKTVTPQLRRSHSNTITITVKPKK